MLPQDDPRTARLAEMGLFEGAMPEEIVRIASLARELTVDRDHVLCREGDVGHEFFVILDGTAEVSVRGRTVARLGQGSGFGEIALVSRYDRRVATVTAASPMTLLALDRDQFASALAEAPTFARALLRETATRLADVEQPIDDDQRLIVEP